MDKTEKTGEDRERQRRREGGKAFVECHSGLGRRPGRAPAASSRFMLCPRYRLECAAAFVCSLSACLNQHCSLSFHRSY